MALEFPKTSFRVGTIKDSFYSILSTIEYLEQNGRIEYQELGASPDGKVTNEFRIFPTNGMAPFAIYDYKFGFDPSDEDNFEEEFEFSIGGASSEAEKSAKKLGFEVVSESMEEAYNISDNEEAVTKEAKDKIKEGTWSVLPNRIPAFIDAIEKIKEEYHSIVGDDTVFNHLDGAIEAAEELMMNTAEVTPEIPGFEGTRDQFDPDEANTYAAFSRMGEGEEEINLSESFVHKMKYRAGIIK